MVALVAEPNVDAGQRGLGARRAHAAAGELARLVRVRRRGRRVGAAREAAAGEAGRVTREVVVREARVGSIVLNVVGLGELGPVRR